MNVKAVIGKNFGDEGKGLTVDRFARKSQKSDESCLVIRHNGGAQAGHTVDLADKRFIFHQLSSGSLRGAVTLWSETFMPDLYKVGNEYQEFSDLSGTKTKIYADRKCRCTYIDDVIINMALETSRGHGRHGSCGMGINECVQRSFHSPLLLGNVKNMSAEELFAELRNIRQSYVPERLKELGIDISKIGEYGELLSEDRVLENAAEQMCRNAEIISIFSYDDIRQYDNIIFEGAQGLLLDEFYLKYEPHLTTSRTGAVNPAAFCRKYLNSEKIEMIYVTRTYVTRHGNGPLPYENSFDFSKYSIVDNTNIPNDWQGRLRFSVHGSTDEFLIPVIEDLENTEMSLVNASLMITHLNETNGMICTNSGEIPVEQFVDKMDKTGVFRNYYYSYSRWADD